MGAGLAGAAVCEALGARGWEVTLHERHAGPAEEASGNHAGTVHPIVTPDDSRFARITRAGFLAALSHWRSLSGVRWDPCGVLQLARDEKEDASQRRAVAGLPPEYAQYVTREEASSHAGVAVAAGGVWFPQGGWIQPRSLVDAQIRRCRKEFSREVKRLPEGVVILANSADAPNLHPVPDLRLRRVRGQLTCIPEERLDAPHVVVLRGGMVLPAVDGKVVVGASYDIDEDDPLPSAQSQAGNLERLERMLGVKVQGEFENRVAFRSVTPDRLPVVGKLSGNVYGAFAYGSRGLVWAALAAEIIACELEGEPLPLAGDLADALQPGRFARRAARGT